MSLLSKDVFWGIIKDSNFQSPRKVLASLKNAFEVVLQEMLEAETCFFERKIFFPVLVEKSNMVMENGRFNIMNLFYIN